MRYEISDPVMNQAFRNGINFSQFNRVSQSPASWLVSVVNRSTERLQGMCVWCPRLEVLVRSLFRCLISLLLVGLSGCGSAPSDTPPNPGSLTSSASKSAWTLNGADAPAAIPQDQHDVANNEEEARSDQHDGEVTQEHDGSEDEPDQEEMTEEPREHGAGCPRCLMTRGGSKKVSAQVAGIQAGKEEEASRVEN